MTDSRNKLIPNTTAGFLTFTGQVGEQSIEARYDEETVYSLIHELVVRDDFLANDPWPTQCGRW
jgi:hypothetical protein